jgi:hypothetical protein
LLHLQTVPDLLMGAVMERKSPMESLKQAAECRTLVVSGAYVTGRRGFISRTVRAAVSHSSARFYGEAGRTEAGTAPQDEAMGTTVVQVMG